MTWLNELNAHSLKRIGSAAIAIRKIRGKQRHAGILFNESGSIQLLHLKDHYKLSKESPTHHYRFVIPSIPTRRAKQIAAICRKIWRANSRNIPFAFSFPNDCFDLYTGKFLLGPTKIGLTCATFVLSIFHTARLPLIKYQNWPLNRPGDREWQQSVLNHLRAVASREHVNEVEKEIGNARFRPEEVAGAAAVNPLPSDFRPAVNNSLKIIKILNNS